MSVNQVIAATASPASVSTIIPPLSTAFGKAPDQLALAGGVRPRGAFAVGGGQPRSESRSGALQGALDRGCVGVEDLRDLGGAEAEHVTQHEPRALAGRQAVEGGDERKLDRLPVITRRRPRRAVR